MVVVYWWCGDYFILDAGGMVPWTQPRRRPFPPFVYTAVSYSPLSLSLCILYGYEFVGQELAGI
jgi:hypothetical protein